MAIIYPFALDTFSVPSLPQSTTLSSAGTSTRDHTQSHQDLGLAVEALEANAAQLTHDHSGAVAGVSIQENTVGSPAQNDTQTVTILGAPTGGTFELTVNGHGSTTAINWNASASTVQTALTALTGLSGNVVVTGGTGGPYLVVFQGSLIHTAMSTITTSSSLTGGTSPQVIVAHNLVGSPGANEVQTVTLTGGPTGGVFSLTFNGFTTANFAFNASAATVQSGLQVLTSVGSSNATVSGSNGGPYTVTFVGALADAQQNLLTYTNGLTGGLFGTNQLDQDNTHQNPDTDISSISIHHTLGLGQGQAAAGNHAHDYSGPSIFNKPYQICTSTTRPPDPFPGLTIFETDTGCWRAWWAANSSNVLQTGMNFTYLFNTDNNKNFLDPAVFTQTNVVGTSPTDGAMGAPQTAECVWNLGVNVPARVISTAVGNQFLSDQQVISFTIGTVTQGAFGSGGKSAPQGDFGTGAKNAPYEVRGVASNDAYLRVSADGQSYVRFGMINAGVAIAYTTSGPTGETLLASINTHAPRLTTPDRPGTVITCKAIGQTYTMYADGQPILSAVDYQNLVHVGAGYRGWAIGMQAAEGFNAQFIPYSISSVSAQDNPQYSTELIWQLLNIGAVPHVRMESRYEQELLPSPGAWRDLLWFFIIHDWIPVNFLNIDVSNTDITIQEAGSYSIHASVPWHPNFSTFDHAAIGVIVNGQDIGRKNWEFVRGNGFAPGFAQTNEIFFSYYFAQGDVVRVQIANNGSGVSYTFYNPSPPFIQTAYAELDFIGPT